MPMACPVGPEYPVGQIKHKSQIQTGSSCTSSSNQEANCSGSLDHLWQIVEKGPGIYFVPDFSLVIGFRKAAPLHLSRLAFQMLVNPSNIAAKIVIALLTVYALITPRLTHNFDLSIQVVVESLQRGAHNLSHSVASSPVQLAIKQSYYGSTSAL